MGLLDGTEVEGGASRYTEIKPEGTKVRVLEAPLVGHSIWTEVDGKSKNVRTQGDVALLPEGKVDKNGSRAQVKQFFAFKVYNHGSGNVEVFDSDKVSVNAQIKKLDEDPDWGDVRKYDLKLSKTGTGMQTEYTVLPVNKGELSEEVSSFCAAEVGKVDLNALLEGKNPFQEDGDSSTGCDADPASVVNAEEVPF